MSTHKYKADNRNDEILIYVNGEIVPRKDAKVSVFDSGFLLGDGVWEGIRYHNKQLVHKNEHFTDSLKVLQPSGWILVKQK